MAVTGKLVIPGDLGDPVSSLFIDGEFVACGTLLGKVWLYRIGRNTRKMFAGFSDEAVRGIYVQDSTLYATIGDQFCRQYRVNDPYDQLDVKFSRRSNGSGFKHVIQHFSQVAVFYPGMTLFVDVVSNTQSMCPYKLQRPVILNVCPIDSYQYLVLFTEFGVSESSSEPLPRKFRLVDVSTSAVRWESDDAQIAHARFINESTLVYVKGRSFVLCNFAGNNASLREFPTSARDVVALDCGLCMGADNPGLILSVSQDGVISALEWTTGKVRYFSRLKSCYSFSLGFPYFVKGFLDDKRALHVAISDDYGVHYMEMKNENGKAQSETV
jgi:hypothetical protein